MIDVEKYLHRFVLNTQNYGKLKILRPIPLKGDPWGVLAPLKETVWGKYIPVVDGKTFSEAVHGYAMPLMQTIGYQPLDVAKVFSKRNPSICRNIEECPMADENVCFPNAKIPDCYEAPGFEEYADRRVASVVAKSWGEGRYVLVVEGKEFSFWKGITKR